METLYWSFTIEILSNLNKQELQIIDEFVKGGDNTYHEWHMLMPNELREVLAKDYKFYLDLTEKGQKGTDGQATLHDGSNEKIYGRIENIRCTDYCKNNSYILMVIYSFTKEAVFVFY